MKCAILHPGQAEIQMTSMLSRISDGRFCTQMYVLQSKPYGEDTCMWPCAGNGIELGENYDEIAESLLKK